MSNLISNESNLGKDVIVVKKLLQNKAALKHYHEVFYPERFTQEKAMEELIKELCFNQRLWLNNEEYDKLVSEGSIVKKYRFSNLEGLLMELVIVDNDENLQDTSELEYTYRHFISFDMIKSFRLIDDDIFTIHLKY